MYALEDKSRSVQRKKQTKYDMKLVSLIREIRKENPSWSAKKIRVILIGTLQTECLDYHYEPLDVHELQDIVDQWIFKYENQRPHEGLDFLTPKQFEATFYTQKHSPVSYLLFYSSLDCKLLVFMV